MKSEEEPHKSSHPTVGTDSGLAGHRLGADMFSVVGCISTERAAYRFEITEMYCGGVEWEGRHVGMVGCWVNQRLGGGTTTERG